jgi:hypothetical protein
MQNSMTRLSRSLSRALAAVVVGRLQKQSPEKMVKTAWPNDHAAALITRATVLPLSTTGAGADITPTLAGSVLIGLAPQSAAARLFALQVLKLDFAGVNQFSIPSPSSAPVPLFVGEGNPMPVGQGNFAPVIVGPVRKMLVGSVVTGELEFAQAETASAIIGRVMSEQAGKSLDAVVFDTNAADSVRPAGLLNGVTPITPTAGGGLNALAQDIGNIAQAVATAGCDPDSLVFVCAAKQAATLRVLASASFTYPILSTPALNAGTVIGIAPAAIATGFDGLPEIELAKGATVHFESTTPQPVPPTR